MAEAKKFYINRLGDEANQTIKVVRKDKIIYFDFYYSYSCYAWFVDIKYKDFVIKKIQVVYTDSLLRQFQNILPFDIQIDSASGLSPLTINSFSDVINKFIVIWK